MRCMTAKTFVVEVTDALYIRLWWDPQAHIISSPIISCRSCTVRPLTHLFSKIDWLGNGVGAKNGVHARLRDNACCRNSQLRRIAGGGRDFGETKGSNRAPEHRTSMRLHLFTLLQLLYSTSAQTSWNIVWRRYKQNRSSSPKGNTPKCEPRVGRSRRRSQQATIILRGRPWNPNWSASSCILKRLLGLKDFSFIK